MEQDGEYLRVEDVSVIHKFQFSFKNFNWRWQRNENWAVLGGNGSGKSLLANIIVSRIKPFKGNVVYTEGICPDKDIAYVSFALQKDLIKIEEKNDQTDLLDGKLDPGTLARDIMLNESATENDLNYYLKLFDCEHISDRGLRFLSTGETRKTLIIKALMSKPKLLVLDEPFDGLDANSRANLQKTLEQCIQQGQAIMLIVNRKEDILKGISHVMILEEFQIKAAGKILEIKQAEEYLNLYNSTTKSNQSVLDLSVDNSLKSEKQNSLIQMKGVNVNYEDNTVLKKLDWEVFTGEHWQIAGVNGSGKTTLLSLINGENPKAYGQNIELFGIKKGSGESIWELKKKMGSISSSFQLKYREELSSLNVVISGFYDSIGIYRNIGALESDMAKEWMRVLKISGLQNKNFNDLSYGEQRMVLLARTMVKAPPLLLLDEPCQGLDEKSAQNILQTIDLVAGNSNSTIVYISHLVEHSLQCVNKVLQLELGGEYQIYER